jgi:hypothetical protein
MREHFRRRSRLASGKRIARCDDMGFGDSKGNAVSDRIGGRILHRNATFAFTARSFAASTFAADTTFTLAAFTPRSTIFARRDLRGLTTRLAADLTARFTAARREHPARERGAKAELGPELELAVHGAGDPLCESIDQARAMAELIIIRKSSFASAGLWRCTPITPARPSRQALC